MLQNLRPPSNINDWRLPADTQGVRDAEVVRREPYVIQKRRVAVEKWPIRFRGDDNPSLSDFLGKIELYARADDVTMNDVFRGFFKLLEDVALEWYEVKAAEFRNWEELVIGLKHRFQSRNYDFIVREEILERYQRAEENIADYLLNMSKLFSKIYPPVDEQYKVYILQRNMISQYRMQLAVANINSVAQLENLCRNIDEARVMGNRERMIKQTLYTKSPADQVRRPVQRCHEVEEEVAEVQVNTNAKIVPRFRSDRRRGFTRREDSTVACWNCKVVGHRHFDCPRPRDRIYCWCCGMEGITADRCPKNHKGANLFSCTSTSVVRESRPEGNDSADR